MKTKAPKSNLAVKRVKPGAAKIAQLQRIFDLMQFQSRMPTNPFLTRDEAYDSAGCSPRSSLYFFANN